MSQPIHLPSFFYFFLLFIYLHFIPFTQHFKDYFTIYSFPFLLLEINYYYQYHITILLDSEQYYQFLRFSRTREKSAASFLNYHSPQLVLQSINLLNFLLVKETKSSSMMPQTCQVFNNYFSSARYFPFPIKLSLPYIIIDT